MSSRANCNRMGLLAFVVYAVLGSGTAVACTCAAHPEDVDKAVALAYARADVVFIGDVTAVKRKLFSLPQTRETAFAVRKAWKGLSNSTALVRTAMGEIACGYKFDKPGKYLVFAYWDQQREMLTTNMCELTRKEGFAGDYIAALDKLKDREIRLQKSPEAPSRE